MKALWTIFGLVLLAFSCWLFPARAEATPGNSWARDATAWALDVDRVPTKDDGSDDGEDDGSDDGEDDGSDDGEDDGSDDGEDDDSDGGNDDDSDGGNDDDSDGGNDDDSDGGNDDDSDGGNDDDSDGGNDDDSDGGNDDDSDGGNDDDGDEVTVGFDDDKYQTSEDEDFAYVTVERSGDATGMVMVDYGTLNGTATAGEDYLATSGTLVWAEGDDDEKVIEIPILEDAIEEGNEDILLFLSNVTGNARIETDDDEARVVILDNDGAFACNQDDDTLCLQDGRFQIEVRWQTGDGTSGQAYADDLSETSGLFWFFSEDNYELMFKVLDGCGVSGLEGYWIFYAATTDLGLVVTVTDTLTGKVKEFENPVGQPAEPVQDLTTFDTCP